MQLMASNSRVFTPAPNFAFELAVRRTSDDDMAGLDLGDVSHIISGAERVHAATLKRFTDRFARFGLRRRRCGPSYGLAEATYTWRPALRVGPRRSRTSIPRNCPPGIAERCAAAAGTGLVSYGVPRTPTVRIVDPETSTENAGRNHR